MMSHTVKLGYYSVFHRFREAKFAHGGSILSSSQFLLLPQQPLKTTITMTVVEINSKIILLLPQSKPVKQTVHATRDRPFLFVTSRVGYNRVNFCNKITKST
jgi:hypothetical protein